MSQFQASVSQKQIPTNIGINKVDLLLSIYLIVEVLLIFLA